MEDVDNIVSQAFSNVGICIGTQTDLECVVCGRLKKTVRGTIVVCGDQKSQLQEFRDKFHIVQLDQNYKIRNFVGHSENHLLSLETIKQQPGIIQHLLNEVERQVVIVFRNCGKEFVQNPFPEIVSTCQRIAEYATVAQESVGHLICKLQ